MTVLGANGHTACFVIAALQRQDVQVAAATRSGRWQTRTEETDCAVLDFADDGALDAAVRGADAVINCAGPFFEIALPAARAAIRAGIPYLDVTAEQATALSLFETLHEAAAKVGSCVVPAMGFYGGLADLLASAVINEGDEVEAIEIAVGLDSWHPTRGTRLTGERNTFERMVVRDGALAPIPAEYPRSNWSFPGKLGSQPVTGVQLSEIVLLSRHVRARSITSYMNLKPIADLGNPDTPPPVAAAKDGQSDQQFVMDVLVSFADGRTRRASASGQDIYAATAPLVVNACLDLCDNPRKIGGVFAPAEVFEPRAFLDGLAPAVRTSFT